MKLICSRHDVAEQLLSWRLNNNRSLTQNLFQLSDYSKERPVFETYNTLSLTKGRRGCYCIVQSIWIIYLNAME
jgi:hypothetical protein